ncbi:MAG TPA: site-specific integrase [Acidimicrobiales bacterium]|nr:site-specific integrase [Acidimicrobiales bacterium]
MASIRQKPSGTWEARYRDPSGRQRAAAFRTKTEARRYLERVGTDKQRGDYLDPTLARTRFEDWAEEWLATTVQLKPKTQVGYKSMLNSHVLPAFSGYAVGSIDQPMVRRFIANMSAADAAPGTIRAARKILRLVLSTAVSGGALRANPCVGVKVARSARAEMHFLSADQVATLAEAIAKPPVVSGGGEHRRVSYPEYEMLVTFAAYSGLRAGEIGALRVGRLDLLSGHVEVAETVSEVPGHGLVFGPPKTYEHRRVPIPRFLCEALAEHLAGRAVDAESFVFLGPDGGALRHNNFYARHFKPAVARADVPAGLRFHDLRHTYAALLIAQGAHVRAMMERLGHSSVTVTLNTYGHLLPGVNAAITDGLDAAGRAARSTYNDAEKVTPLRSRQARSRRPRRTADGR